VSLINKGYILIAGTILTAILGMVQGIIIARFLGPAGMGQYQMPTSLGLVIATVLMFGIGLANVYFLNFHKCDPKKILTNSLVCGSVLGLIAAAIMYYFFSYQHQYTGAVSGATKIIFAMGIGLMVLVNIVKQILIAKMKIFIYSLVNVTSGLSMLLLLAALIAFRHLNVEMALIAASVCQLIAFGVVAYGLREDISFNMWADFGLMWRTFKYGLHLYAVNLLLTLDTNIGLLCIGFLMPGAFSDIGYFSRAMAICGLMRLLPTSLTNLLYSHWCSVQGEARTQQVEKMVRVNLLVGSVIFLGILLGGQYLIVIIYGRAFLPALLPLQILALQQLMWMISKVFQAFFAGAGRPSLTSINVGIANVISIFSLFALIPPLGITGAAIALTVGQAVYLGMNFFQARRFFGLKISHAVSLQFDDLRFVAHSLCNKRN
jgi:O-antigen/teichoic acid export membrane protein